MENPLSQLGIIYVHPISQTAEQTNIKMYRALCGRAALCNSAIVTTMWGETDHGLGEERAEELKSDITFFKHAIGLGAKFIQYNDDQTSAHDIIRQVLSNSPKPLCIQRELIDERKRPGETCVGGILRTYLDDQLRNCDSNQPEAKESVLRELESLRTIDIDRYQHGRGTAGSEETVVELPRHAQRECSYCAWTHYAHVSADPSELLQHRGYRDFVLYYAEYSAAEVPI